MHGCIILHLNVHGKRAAAHTRPISWTAPDHTGVCRPLNVFTVHYNTIHPRGLTTFPVLDQRANYSLMGIIFTLQMQMDTPDCNACLHNLQLSVHSRKQQHIPGTKPRTASVRNEECRPLRNLTLRLRAACMEDTLPSHQAIHLHTERSTPRFRA